MATDAPPAWLGHDRQVHAIAPKYDLEIHQMGLCTVFIGVDFEEHIYMHPALVLAPVPGYPSSVLVGTDLKAPVSVRHHQGTRPTLSWRVCYADRP
jgi:hypothetical protein